MVTLSKSQQTVTAKLIHQVITGKLPTQELVLLIKQFEDPSLPVILGCTELSVLHAHIELPNVIDPLELVADEIMKDTV